MKKLGLLVLSCLLLLSSCYKDDINSLKDDVNKLKEQMARYETLLNALSNNLYVTSYEQRNGYYILTMSDGSQLTVRDTSAFIKIGDNGNWFIDGEDTGIAASGTNEATSVAIGSNGNWFINGEDTGVKAAGQDGQSGAEIISISMVDGVMTFYFSDGRTIQLQVSTFSVTITEPSGGFVFDQLQWVRVNPAVSGEEGVTYSWTLDGDEISAEKDLLHVFTESGTYTILYTATKGAEEVSKTVVVTVNSATYSNNVVQVFEYMPAPGQFVNTLPAWVSGETAEDVRLKAENALKSRSMIHLGGFGGYVVMGFDHTIVNRPDDKDFVVLGNALASWAEPGVILVSYDANGNGQPDDEWYEIAGSEYSKPTTIHNYEITYYKPDPDKVPTPGGGSIVDDTYIRWTDNQGGSGYLSKNSFHSQNYYPEWITEESITFTGSLLECNIYDQSGQGTYWVNPAYDYGYADNWMNNDAKGHIEIDWAVDKDGNPVKLKGVDFIKVYTANRAEGGWLGEVSTEITGVSDLTLE